MGGRPYSMVSQDVRETLLERGILSDMLQSVSLIYSLNYLCRNLVFVETVNCVSNVFCFTGRTGADSL